MMEPFPQIIPQPTAPVPQALRPMTVTELLDAAFRLYRAHFVTFLGIVALLQVPMTIITSAVQYVLGEPLGRALQRWFALSLLPPLSPIPGASPIPLARLPVTQIVTYAAVLIGLGLLQTLLVNSLITGALANAISRSYLGTPTTIIGAYRFGGGRLLSLVGMSLLLSLGGLLITGLLIGCPTIAVLALVGRGGGDTPSSAVLASFGLAMLVLVPLFLVIFAFFAVRLLVGTQAVVLEGRGPFSSLQRSWGLSRGSFWRILGALVLMTLLVVVVAGVPQQIIAQLLGNSFDQFGRNQAIITLVTQIGTMIVQPFQLALFTLLYYDLRVRKEGYDLEMRSFQPVTL